MDAGATRAVPHHRVVATNAQRNQLGDAHEEKIFA
jgi:hypothetical protein